mmetsp:Transcript_17147/g.28664  ORF Transcript_17147/g.28664 Transcript_17147/m.28664 type:complete len:419 (+) Transcript_17147:80-1336(+)|eukprot:CAMPEP_0114419154 /NCGR_PEP_ID=MMETSP0103-20121206/3877_1 /TAXON_ID=37642 ORGANISM="Paraphysomonas imperforata, Strain PA2" /NCGR_SAMPLE_ID=MMETSP0103 /ASSEMBLY_ACC=CAM_ASM_000201 /LENGTH=418 /DNA_ID=CAMNT_0001587557 /DNA_START=11 /DNA_END=1267 /DNA_ORIENTATION=+
MVKVKGGVKRTPYEYLDDILTRAQGLQLVTQENASHVLQQAEKIQENIDIWRPLVRKAENEPVKEWVVTALAFLATQEVNERIDDEVFTSYSEACDKCRTLNITTGTSANKPKKCRVVEKKDSIACGAGEGRTCFQLLGLSPSATEVVQPPQPPTKSEQIERNLAGEKEDMRWGELLGEGNGYLALRNKNIVVADVAGIMACVTLAKGRVTQLGLSQNSLRSAGISCLMSELLQPVPCFKNICALYLSNNSIGDDGALSVASFLRSGQLPIVKLGLNSNGITDVGAEAIASVIEDSNDRKSILEVVGLSHNYITAKSAVIIASAVSHNSSLQRLFLNYNPLIGDTGGVALAEASQGHSSLLRVGVAFCSLESKSGEALMAAMSSTDSIERICVSGNNFHVDIENRMHLESRFNFSEVK